MAQQDQAVSKRWLNLLSEEGYRPHLEVNEEQKERSRILFKIEGTRYVLYLDEQDPAFFNLSISYRLGDVTDEPEILLIAANEVCKQAKGTKVTIDLEGRVVYCNMEWFGDSLPSAKLFERIAGQCTYSVDGFFTRVREMSQPVPLP